MLSTLRALSTLVAAIGLMVVFQGSAQAQSWQRVSPAGAGFSILMPSTPEASTSNVATVMGPVTVHLYKLQSSTEGYFVSYNDFQAGVNVQRFLDGVRDSAFTSGHVSSESNSSLNGNPVRTIVGTMGAFQATLKFFIANGRFYQVLYLTFGLSPQNADTFFDSFRILR